MSVTFMSGIIATLWMTMPNARISRLSVATNHSLYQCSHRHTRRPSTRSHATHSQRRPDEYATVPTSRNAISVVAAGSSSRAQCRRVATTTVSFAST